MKPMLVATDNQEAIRTIKGCFQSHYKVDVASDRAHCFETARSKRYEFIFIDISFLQDVEQKGPLYDYNRGLHFFWNIYPTVEIIVLSSQELIREVVNAVKAGASNYLTYPINIDEVKYITESIYESIRMQYELDYLRDKFWHNDSLEVIRTNSPLMKKVFDKVKMVAPTKTTVLLTGETGTGRPSAERELPGIVEPQQQPGIRVLQPAYAASVHPGELRHWPVEPARRREQLPVRPQRRTDGV